MLEKGTAQLIGAGARKRNFIAATEVAQFAVRALLEDPVPFAALDIGGHDHLSNAEVAELYAREAASHRPSACGCRRLSRCCQARFARGWRASCD